MCHKTFVLRHILTSLLSNLHRHIRRIARCMVRRSGNLTTMIIVIIINAIFSVRSSAIATAVACAGTTQSICTSANSIRLHRARRCSLSQLHTISLLSFKVRRELIKRKSITINHSSQLRKLQLEYHVNFLCTLGTRHSQSHPQC